MTSEKGLSGFDITVKDLSFFYEEMVRSNLLELEIDTAGGKIVLKRVGHDTVKGFPMRRKSDFMALPGGSAVQVPASAGAPSAEEQIPSNYKPIPSPITGVFYRASSPQSPPLVKEGDPVEPGMTLCIVEAMKVMNEIKADSRCRIVKILVENAKPVNKDQPLFHVQPLS